MITTEAPQREELLERARVLAPVIRAGLDEMDERRGLPQTLVDALIDAGLFQMWVPRFLGGLEVDLRTCLEVIEEISRADGSVAWNVQIGAGASLFWGYLPEEAARRAYGGNPRSIMAGSLHPSGEAVARAESGGYRVSGRWAFTTGCDYATWLMASCPVRDTESLRLDANGRPDPYMFFFPKEEAEIIDTWSAVGLRGTGSRDIAVSDLFVPGEYAIRLFADDRPRPEPLYRLRFDTLVPVLMAPVAIGLARSAIDALVELAGVKTPARTQSLLRERAMVQADVARAEAVLGSARAFLFDIVDKIWAEVMAGGSPSLTQRARLRLATAHAVESSAKVVDMMYSAGGGTSVYTSSPFERLFRDIHVVTQHASVSPVNYEPIGRVLLGMEPGIARF